MKIVLFASPGVLGPFVFASLIQLKKNIPLLVIPSSSHSVSAAELYSLAEHAHSKVVSPKQLNDDMFLRKIDEISPDIILVATFDKKLPEILYKKASIGAFNIHPSLLPMYKGACPEFWVLKNDEKITGVTLHHLSNEFDSGNIVLQEEVAIENTDTAGSLVYRLSAMAAKIVMRFIEMIDKKLELKGLPQKQGDYPTAPMVGTNELKIDWQEKTNVIYNLIRAANPIGGAWARFRGFQIKIWYAIPFVQDDAFVLNGIYEPGNILLLPKDKKMLLKTSDGFLEIKVIQHALYYIVDGWSFACMAQIVEGERLD